MLEKRGLWGGRHYLRTSGRRVKDTRIVFELGWICTKERGEGQRDRWAIMGNDRRQRNSLFHREAEKCFVAFFSVVRRKGGRNEKTRLVGRTPLGVGIAKSPILAPLVAESISFQFKTHQKRETNEFGGVCSHILPNSGIFGMDFALRVGNFLKSFPEVPFMGRKKGETLSSVAA